MTVARAAALVIIALALLAACQPPPTPTPETNTHGFVSAHLYCATHISNPARHHLYDQMHRHNGEGIELCPTPTPAPTPTATPTATKEQLAQRLRSLCIELPDARGDFQAAQRQYDDLADAVLAYADRIMDDRVITAREGEQNRANGDRLRGLSGRLEDARRQYNVGQQELKDAERALGSTCSQRPWLRFAPTPTPAPTATPRPTSTMATPTPGPTPTLTMYESRRKASRARRRCESSFPGVFNTETYAGIAWGRCYDDLEEDRPEPVTRVWCTHMDDHLEFGRDPMFESWVTNEGLEQKRRSQLIPNCEGFGWTLPPIPTATPTPTATPAPTPTPTPSGPMLSEADCQKVVDDYMGSLVEDVIADYPVALWGDEWQEQSFRYWTEGVYGDRRLLGFNLQYTWYGGFGKQPEYHRVWGNVLTHWWDNQLWPWYMEAYVHPVTCLPRQDVIWERLNLWREGWFPYPSKVYGNVMVHLIAPHSVNDFSGGLAYYLKSLGEPTGVVIIGE